jgi:hypothetical protein
VHQALRAVEHQLALRREAVEPPRARDDPDAELALDLPDGGGEGRLGDAASLGGAAEMAFAGQRDQIGQVLDELGSMSKRRRGERGAFEV